MIQAFHSPESQIKHDEKYFFQKTLCMAKYLCQKPLGAEECFLTGKDWRSCQNLNEENIMYISPEKIKCVEACKCKYAGKRESHCDSETGHDNCGTILNGQIPEGDISKSLVDKVRQIISFCRT